MRCNPLAVHRRARTVKKLWQGCDQLDLGLFATVLIGTSTTPRPSAVLAHSAMRSIDAGRAAATPTARPCSRATASSRAKARSICATVGTASSAISALANGTLLAPAVGHASLRADQQ